MPTLSRPDASTNNYLSIGEIFYSQTTLRQLLSVAPQFTNMETKLERINSTLVLDLETARVKNRYFFPKPLKTDLHRWMISNNVCYANGFRTDGVLDDFLQDYVLFDLTKLLKAETSL